MNYFKKYKDSTKLYAFKISLFFQKIIDLNVCNLAAVDIQSHFTSNFKFIPENMYISRDLNLSHTYIHFPSELTCVKMNSQNWKKI